MKKSQSMNKKSIVIIASVFFAGGVLFSIMVKPFLVLFFVIAGLFTLYKGFKVVKESVNTYKSGIRDITPQKMMIENKKSEEKRIKNESEIIICENYFKTEENRKREAAKKLLKDLTSNQK